MRIKRLFLALLVAIAVIFPQFAKASEIGSDTNTNTTISFFSNIFTPNAALADEGVNQAVVSDEPQKTAEELKNEQILAMWKTKQTDKWARLSKETFTVNASAYTASADECDKADGVTASGIIAKANRTIACPPEFPFGTKIKIGDLGTFVCEDRGGAIKGNKIDIFMNTKQEAFSFGRQNLIAQVVD